MFKEHVDLTSLLKLRTLKLIHLENAFIYWIIVSALLVLGKKWKIGFKINWIHDVKMDYTES